MSKNVKIKRNLFATPILVIRGVLTKIGVTGRDTGWPPILVTPFHQRFLTRIVTINVHKFYKDKFTWVV